ncbi:hypothetical protein [Streptomyces alanosinicus]|uniref:Uncharacterized protein n=1 Tax=Streptomyces alanosinicus TaxID=68171 RepID=A0A918YEN7_9ACTN|nr:hypothetical protein [Streptomyces alanosinicus]GHE00324.1 hypothetical protein GCM10010339_15040 [Streptomyces alanosinicus]
MTTSATPRDNTDPEWAGIRTLGHANRFGWWDSEFRYDGRMRVPMGVNIKEVRYSFRGDGQTDVQATQVPRGQSGVDQQYEVIEHARLDGFDVITFTLRGDLDVDKNPRPDNSSLKYAIDVRVTLDNGEVRRAAPEIDVLASDWDPDDAPDVGRPYVRLPFDSNWGGSPNSQAGFGYVSDNGFVPGDKFIIDLVNPREGRQGVPSNHSDTVYYQLVHEDGTPSLETQVPQPWKAEGHTGRGDLSHKTMLPAIDLRQKGDKPGYYRFLVWPQAANFDGSVSNLSWDPTKTEDAFQLGSVYYRYTASGGIDPAPQGQFVVSPGDPVTVPRTGETKYPGVVIQATGDGKVPAQTVTVTLPLDKGLRFTGRLVVGVMRGSQWVQIEQPDGTLSADGRVLTVKNVDLALTGKGSKSAVLVEVQASAGAMLGDTSLSFLVGGPPASSSSLIHITDR